jgi:hypothetical protein
MSLPWYENALGHFAAGITLSFADRAFSENARRKTDERVEKKMQEVTSLQYLVDHASHPDSASNREYGEAINDARSFFQRKGMRVDSEQRNENPFRYIGRKIVNGINHCRSKYERINNLPWSTKLVTAFGGELALDLMVVATQAIYGMGNGMGALARTPIQTVSLWAGMQTGKGTLYMKDLFVKSKEEKELDSIGRELIADGKLLEVVRNYSSTRGLEVKVIEAEVVEPKELPAGEEKAGYTAAQVGEKVGTKLADAADGVRNGLSAGLQALRERREARKQAQQAEEEARRKKLSERYKDY